MLTVIRSGAPASTSNGGASAQALGHPGGGLKVGLRQDDRELLAAIAAHTVDGACLATQQLAQPLENGISCRVSVRVVDVLEVVDVEQQQRERALEALRPRELVPEQHVEGAVVVESGETVAGREFSQCRLVLFEFLRHDVEGEHELSELVRPVRPSVPSSAARADRSPAASGAMALSIAPSPASRGRTSVAPANRDTMAASTKAAKVAHRALMRVVSA